MPMRIMDGRRATTLHGHHAYKCGIDLSSRLENDGNKGVNAVGNTFGLITNVHD